VRYYPVETPDGWVVALCAVSGDECATVLTEKGAREWADRLNGKSEALCPRCGSDVVLPPGFPFEWANCPECGLNGGDWVTDEPEARIQTDSVTPADAWTLTEQSLWIRPYYVVHATGDVDKMGRVFFDKELARKYRDSWVNATYVVERYDPDGTSCIEP
jgi:hypothetical protein